MPATTPSDSWDSPSTGIQSAVLQRPRQPAPVKDDWDDDDDSDADEDPQKMWEDANTKAPMPELVIAPTSTTSAAPAVPAAALQPALRILKRPSAPASPTPPTPPPGDAQRSLAEREAQYRAARERIFGSASDAPQPPADAPSPAAASTTAPPPELAAKPIRNPRGPDPSGGTAAARGAGPSRGFRGSHPRNTSTRGRPT